MADFTNSRDALGGAYPVNAIDTAWGRTAPLITPEDLRLLHLFGINLYGRVKDPNTGLFPQMTDEHLKRYIENAVGLVEAETGIWIMPTQIKEKKAFDKVEYENFGYFKLRQRPCASVEAVQIVPSNEMPILYMPAAWIDIGNLHMGQLNIIPLTISYGSGATVPTANGFGSAMLSVFGRQNWVASFWEITYTVGFKNGLLPTIINDLIGVTACCEILSMLATTYSRSTSQSLSVDGLSQASSGPGPEIFNTRLEALAIKRKWLVGKCKGLFGVKYNVDNV